MKQEIWKEIYENYEISSFGRLRSKKRNKLIKLEEEKRKGYIITKIKINGKRTRIGVHRLVALAFIPNPLNLPQVNHKDENKKNNCASNLEWCDAKYNANYGSSKEKRSKRAKGKNNPFFGKKHSQQSKEKMSQSRKRYILENPDFRIKMSEAATKRFKEKNKWIFKGDKEKRISEQELSIYLNDGWCLGKKSNPAISQSLKKYFNEHPEKKYWGANQNKFGGKK